MSEFLPCPVTGKVPEWRESDYRLMFMLPFMSSDHVSRFCGERDAAIKWWNKEYIPAARKLTQPEEWVPQVGDVVGPSIEGWEALANDYDPLNGTTQSVIVEVRESSTAKTVLLRLEDQFYVDDDGLWSPRFLRLISRPKPLTVADLPEIEEVRVARHGLHWFVLVCDYKYGGGYRTEHEAVQAALDFCNRITDGTLAKRGGSDE